MPLSFRSRPSARLRLTFTYAALFILAGGMLLSFNYFLTQQRLDVRASDDLHARVDARLGAPFPGHDGTRRPERAELDPIVEEAAREVWADALRQLLIQSGVALAAMAALSAGLGWLMAGRVLRPVHQITGTARRISESDLHQRIELQGPDDEFKKLADTFDEMLARLDAAFESQRHFVANASHELRTPLSIIRTELDVTLANPDVTPAEVQEMAEALRGAIARSERLIESLLFLARSESGIHERHPIDLATVARDVLGDIALPAEQKGVTLRERLSPARVDGDPALVERLLGNLVENALAYNHQGGWIEVSARQTLEAAELLVANSGPVVPAEGIDSLFQPFRQARRRTASSGSVGLGLSIVRAVARAHGGDVTAKPGPDGGLEVVLLIPTGSTSDNETIPAPLR